MTIFGAVQLLAAAGVWAGNQLARWFAVAVVGLNAIAQMFFIPAYPFWSLMIIAAVVDLELADLILRDLVNTLVLGEQSADLCRVGQDQ